MSKVVLVTGGAGFIGSHLIEKLKEDKNAVIISLDNYFTGKKENHHDGVTYIEGHTKDIDILITTKPDIVYHLGEYSRVERSFEDVAKVFEFNKVGTFAVIEFCRKHNAKLVYAGSSTKFGDGGLGRDQSPYAWTKASNTELINNYANWFGINHAIVYFYNVYGGREISSGKYATVVAIFKEKYKNKEPTEVVSPGTQLRNFTHIEDIVRGLILVGEKGQGDDYGIGAEEAHSILDLAKMFNTSIIMLPERKGNRMGAMVNTNRIKNELGWEAKNKLKDHILEFISLHKDNQ